jgi:hypothetical protein
VDARDRAALVSRLASAPARVAAAAPAAHPDPGEWAAREVVGHLVAVETAVWQARLDQLSTIDGPAWTWTEPGVSSDPRAATLDGALARFAALRAATVARVRQLDEGGWSRTGVHATFGRLDVAGLLRVAVAHDDEHLAALEASAVGRFGSEEHGV